MKIRGLIFDLDGTLLDTLDDIAESMNAVLENHGFPAYPVDAYRYFVGDGMDTLVERTVPESWRDSQTLADCLQEVKILYGSRCSQKTAPYEGIVETLEVLDKSGIELAVLSNKVHEITVATVKHFFGDIRFSQVVGAGGRFRKKPDPQAAQFIASQWNINCNEILYIGDTMVDMKTAVGAGMHPAGVLWGFRDEKELRENGAEFILEKPSEICDILNQINRGI